MALTQAYLEKEQQRIAVGPGNGHFISVRQMSSDAATLQRGRCRHCCTAAPPLPLVLLCVGSLMIKN